MDLFFKALTTALAADPLNLALCTILVLAISVVIIAWRKG